MICTLIGHAPFRYAAGLLWSYSISIYRPAWKPDCLCTGSVKYFMDFKDIKLFFIVFYSLLQMVRNYLDKRTQEIMLDLAAGYSPKTSLQKLQVANISGALFILLFGSLFALLAFLMELFWQSVKMDLHKLFSKCF